MYNTKACNCGFHSSKFFWLYLIKKKLAYKIIMLSVFTVTTLEPANQFSRNFVRIFCHWRPLKPCTYWFPTISNINMMDAQTCSDTLCKSWNYRWLHFQKYAIFMKVIFCRMYNNEIAVKLNLHLVFTLMVESNEVHKLMVTYPWCCLLWVLCVVR